MKLSTRFRYGTRALIDMTLNAATDPMPLNDIAKRQDISLKYLEHLVPPLVQAGIVSSTRGPRGGIRMLRQPKDINLGELYEIYEGGKAVVNCLYDRDACPRVGYCRTHPLWREVNDAILGVFRSKSLADLIEGDTALADTASRSG